MNATPATKSRKEGVVTAIGVLVLLIGAATGNAFAMLAMSVAAIAVIATFYRQALGSSAWLLMSIAAGTLVAIGMVLWSLS